MSEQFQIGFTLTSTNPTVPLGAEVWLDKDLLLDVQHVDQPIVVNQTFSDSEADHELRIILKNKLLEHTHIDEQGNIIKDARLVVDHLSFDEIELKQIFIEQAVYSHNNNGATGTVSDTFYGEMGCNGTVSLSFTTPIYLWLLENM
jgi:hypothetical protein